MSPDIYFRIVLLMIVRDTLVVSFSLIDFLSHGGEEIVKNAGAQFLGYGFGVLTNRPIEPIKFLPPVISYAPQAYDFVTQATGVTKTERIATLAFIFSGTGLLSKTGDPVLNAGAGSFIYLLAEYLETFSQSGGGSFIMPLPSRNFRRFTKKQHRQCQLAITGIIIVTIGGSYVLVLIVKRVFKSVKLKFKKALTKSSKIKAKIKSMKIFKSKSKVQFIPLH